MYRARLSDARVDQRVLGAHLVVVGDLDDFKAAHRIDLVQHVSERLQGDAVWRRGQAV